MDLIQLKAVTIIASIRGAMISNILQEAKRKSEYCKDKPEEAYKYLEMLADPSKWEYMGFLTEKNKAILETLEFLLDDNMIEIKKY